LPINGMIRGDVLFNNSRCACNTSIIGIVKWCETLEDIYKILKDFIGFIYLDDFGRNEYVAVTQKRYIDR